MAWIAVSCPQCGSPLPRLAIWRTVTCLACGSLITKTESIVKRDSFRQALNRARLDFAGLDGFSCGGHRYQLIRTLGNAEISQVYLGRRIDAIPFLATIKISSAKAAAQKFAREAEVLQSLQSLNPNGDGAYFSRLLPEFVAHGTVDNEAGKQALIVRHPIGFWGSVAALNERFPEGIDPRHAVWIWRRMLEVLNFIHRHGWCHGDLRPEHALINPQDHGVRLISWSAARNAAGEKDQTADLSRSARTVLILLSGTSGSTKLPRSVPSGLADLVEKAASDEKFCRSQDADGLDKLVQAESKTAFGPPAFVPLII